jgi:hypothetical protein
MTNSAVLMNPYGGEADWGGTMPPALETNLMERVLDSENLHRAWKPVKSNQGAPSIDGMVLETLRPTSGFTGARFANPYEMDATTPLRCDGS